MLCSDRPNVPHACAARIHQDDLLAKAGKAALILADQDRIEATMPVLRKFSTIHSQPVSTIFGLVPLMVACLLSRLCTKVYTSISAPSIRSTSAFFRPARNQLIQRTSATRQCSATDNNSAHAAAAIRRPSFARGRQPARLPAHANHDAQQREQPSLRPVSAFAAPPGDAPTRRAFSRQKFVADPVILLPTAKRHREADHHSAPSLQE